MPRPRKVPAVLVEATVRRNAKLANLPSDTARLGFFYVVLGDAKISEPVPGQFASRALFKDVAGRFARYVEDYIKAGLLEVAPKLCDRCKARWASMPPKSGALVVHDWHEHQYDPRKIERQREYEDRQRAQSDAISDGVSDAQSDAVSDEFPTGDSRAARDARDTGAPRTSNVELEPEEELGVSPDVVYPANGKGTRSIKGFAPVGDVVEVLDEQTEHWTRAVTLSERDEWSSFGPEWDAFKTAWLKRGFRHPPNGDDGDDPSVPNPSQRALLWSILDARPTDLPRWITEAPKRLSASQVVGYATDRWHGVRDEGNTRADADETKAPAWMDAS